MAAICIGGVCIPYSAVVPFFLYGIQWVLAKLQSVGLLPNFIAQMLNLNHVQQGGKSLSTSDKSGTETSKDEKSTSAENISGSSVDVIEIVSDEQFYELSQKNEKMVVKCTADWCQPCKKIHPFYQAKSAEYPKYDFVTLDVDEFDGVVETYRISMMPTFLILEGQSLVGTYRGSNEPELETFLRENL